jgi:hypothetical protein
MARSGGAGRRILTACLPRTPPSAWPRRCGTGEHLADVTHDAHDVPADEPRAYGAVALGPAAGQEQRGAVRGALARAGLDGTWWPGPRGVLVIAMTR